ncbi:MAG: FAD-binding protein [Deltaproteobacteria bacterium]|nr:FAD-binding protein [Deltaproteobacteria bacterium]
MRAESGSSSMVVADVLVIGGGGAGAAMWAKKSGANSVGIVEKGVLGESGCTVMGTYSCCAALGYADPRDNPQVHYEDTFKAGGNVGDPALVRVYAEEAPARVLELAEAGVPFEREGSRLKQGYMEGHTYPRACYVGMRTGQAMQWGLRRNLERTPGVRRYNDVQIYRLLSTEGKVWGAMGWDRKTLTPVQFLAKATVIATGGCGQLYTHTTTSLDNTGDGLALAWEAGASLKDMEFVQFYPMAWIYPRVIGLNRTPAQFLRFVPGSRMYNAQGEDFLDAPYPDWRRSLTRDLLAQAMYREIIEGRGGPHGGVFIDVTAASLADIEGYLSTGGFFQKIKGMGIDLKRTPLEVGVASHFLMGGIYARPENALSEILVTGARAGEGAARFALKRQEPVPSLPLKTEWEDWIEGLLSNPRPAMPPGQLKESLQDCMWRYGGVIRTSRGLAEGQEKLARLQTAFGQEMSLSYGPRAYHMELQDAIETRLMLEVARVILTAAQRREESRGAHFREDFPETKEDWRANLILTKAKDEIVCEKRIG